MKFSMSFLCLALLSLGFSVPEVFAEPPVVIVALGDSTTAGTPGFRSPVEAPPEGRGNPESQYAYWLMKAHPDWMVLNRGINGERTDQILKRFDADVKAAQPRVVIVLAGVNDLYQGFPSGYVRENLIKIYDLAGENGIKVLACTILPYNFVSPEILNRIREVNDWIRQYTKRKGFGYCDTYQAVENPSRPGTLAGSPEGLHPDVAGYRRMAEAMDLELSQLLRE